jgi:hypothetical protein
VIVARVKWGNVAKLLAVLGLVGVVVAWPRLREAAPVVPVGRARPVVSAPVVPVRISPRRRVKPTPRRVRERPRARHRHSLRRKGPYRTHSPERAPAPPPPVKTPPPSPKIVSPDAIRAAEFG